MKLFFKILGSLLLLVVLIVGGFLAKVQITGIPSYKTQKVDLKVEVTPERVERGKIIANMLCKQCHLDVTTGKLTGHLLEDVPPEFGAAYSRNITHDPNTESVRGPTEKSPICCARASSATESMPHRGWSSFPASRMRISIPSSPTCVRMIPRFKRRMFPTTNPNRPS